MNFSFIRHDSFSNHHDLWTEQIKRVTGQILSIDFMDSAIFVRRDQESSPLLLTLSFSILTIKGEKSSKMANGLEPSPASGVALR
jgi:hypothetical protein